MFAVKSDYSIQTPGGHDEANEILQSRKKENNKSLLKSKLVTAPNGTNIIVWTDGQKYFVKLIDIYKSLGYKGHFGLNTKLGKLFKGVNRFKYFIKNTSDSGNTVFVIELSQVVPMLKAFVCLETESSVKTFYDSNALVESQYLIDKFNSDVFKNINDANADVVGTNTVISKSSRLYVAKLLDTIVTEPYQRKINVYLYSSGKTFICIDELVSALCDNYDFNSKLETLQSILNKKEKYRIRLTNSVFADALDTYDVISVLKRFEQKESSDVVSVNACTIQECLREYSYFNRKDDIQMKNSQAIKNIVDEPAKEIYVVSVADIEDIGNRASKIAKVYDTSFKDSLIAATKLKAVEINRDLTPLLEMFD